ncbi:hypothetical protein R1flu_010907 [Riccia fluitans]|uniref:Uncharacterized protein n=1 Tax=Riccia fluitans TaxID=41844 RepID=A0ABD1Z6B8_9MARC
MKEPTQRQSGRAFMTYHARQRGRGGEPSALMSKPLEIAWAESTWHGKALNSTSEPFVNQNNCQHGRAPPRNEWNTNTEAMMATPKNAQQKRAMPGNTR